MLEQTNNGVGAIVDTYLSALRSLIEEGNEAAIVAYDTMKNGNANVVNWVMNIHNNTWGTNSLGSTLKAKVVLKRIKDGPVDPS